MAVTSPPRSTPTSPPGPFSRHANSPNQPGGQLRVHWDRVAILAAILVLIVVLIVVLVVRAFTAAGSEDNAVAATEPIEAANPTATQNTTAAEPNPTVAEGGSVPTAAAKPCPTPSVKPIYAAPPVVGGETSVRT